MSQAIIRVVNPIQGGSAFTTPKRAHSYVQRGRAVWVGAGLSTIRFTDEDEQQKIALRKATNDGYATVDRRLTLDEMRHVPIIQPWKLMLQASRRERQAR